MSPFIQIGVGCILLISGALHRVSSLDSIDRNLGLELQTRLIRPPWISFFKILWPIGRGEFAVLALIGLVLFSPIEGICATLVYLAFGGIDRLIKLAFKRARPFERQPGAQMLQPHRPKDPSFPSGDTFHTWFLALTAILVFHLLPGWIVFLMVVAILVSLGRVVLGVHYPLDVLAGAGIGFIAAGLEGIIFIMLIR